MHERDWHDIELLLLLVLERKGKWSARKNLLRTLQKVVPNTTVDLLVGGGRETSDAARPYIRRQLADEGCVFTPDERARPRSPVAIRKTIEEIRAGRYAAALICTESGISPWMAGYVCCMAGVPVRIGMSDEFGGNVLSHCVDPPDRTVGRRERYDYLLEAVGLPDISGAAGRTSGNVH